MFPPASIPVGALPLRPLFLFSGLPRTLRPRPRPSWRPFWLRLGWFTGCASGFVRGFTQGRLPPSAASGAASFCTTGRCGFAPRLRCSGGAAVTSPIPCARVAAAGARGCGLNCPEGLPLHAPRTDGEGQKLAAQSSGSNNCPKPPPILRALRGNGAKFAPPRAPLGAPLGIDC